MLPDPLAIAIIILLLAVVFVSFSMIVVEIARVIRRFLHEHGLT